MTAASQLQLGIDALNQGNYARAIQILEKYCADTDLGNPTLMQGQSWLVRVYLKAGHSGDAAALCQRLLQSGNPQMQQWAEKTLATISDQPAAPPAAAPEILAQSPPQRSTKSSAITLQFVSELRGRVFRHPGWLVWHLL